MKVENQGRFSRFERVKDEQNDQQDQWIMSTLCQEKFIEIQPPYAWLSETRGHAALVFLLMLYFALSSNFFTLKNKQDEY